MSEHRTPEVKSIISELEKKIKEVERKAYVDPVKAEEAKEKGNEFFNKGNFEISFIFSTIILKFLLVQVSLLMLLKLIVKLSCVTRMNLNIIVIGLHVIQN